VAKQILSPTLFDLVVQYAAELQSGIEFKNSVVPETSPILTFCQNAFAQFFDNELDSEIHGFDFRLKLKAARLRRKRKDDLSQQAKALISLYEQFCDIYDSVLGAGYGGSASVLEAFHTRFVVRLLERLRALFGAKMNRELRARADEALTTYKAAIKDYDWSK